MKNLSLFVVLLMTIFVVSGARETRMMKQKTCPVFWPIVPCDPTKCEKMCNDFYGPVSVSSYCYHPGQSNAACTCVITNC
ncbi:unnamed protein product [Cochlearia groenlandica]